MKFIVLLLFELMFCDAVAQIIKIPLTNTKGAYGIRKLYRKGGSVQDVSGYKGYDTLDYDNWTIKKVDFNNAQRLKEEVLNKNLLNIAYADIIKSDPSIDTTSIWNGYIPRNSIAAFVAMKGHLKYIVVDGNGNKDFSDDKVYTFDLSKEKVYPEIYIEIDYFDGSHIKSAKIPFNIDAYVDMPTENRASKLGIRLIDQSYKQGLYKEEHEQFRITADNAHFFLYKNEIFWLCIDSVGKKESVNDRYIYTSRDSIPIGDKLFIVKSIANDTLYLSYIAPYHKNAGEINTIAPNIIEGELITKRHFSLYKKRGQYVLLDFWGSWCRPCIDLLPGLINVHDKYKKNGLQVVSIALDRKEDINKLKDLIIDHKLKWEHLFVDRDGAQKITKDYKVQIYPTIILINPEGKVVCRGTGEKALTQINIFLQNVYKMD